LEYGCGEKSSHPLADDHRLGERENGGNGMRNWRFIPYQTASAALNMAIDEAIMKAHREGKVCSTLRF
jgi:hypothetical protein